MISTRYHKHLTCLVLHFMEVVTTKPNFFRFTWWVHRPKFLLGYCCLWSHENFEPITFVFARLTHLSCYWPSGKRCRCCFFTTCAKTITLYCCCFLHVIATFNICYFLVNPILFFFWDSPWKDKFHQWKVNVMKIWVS